MKSCKRNIYVNIMNSITLIVCLFYNTDGHAADAIMSYRMKPDDFTVLKTIGRGAFGEVQLVRIQSYNYFK